MDSSANSKLCAVCRSKASQICGGCGDVHYCSKEHQKQHWTSHKADCKPYKILTDSKFGRYMVASRNLKAGEIIFRERALAVGPKQGSPPVCLACYSRLEAENPYRCPGCNFPFCEESCAKNSVHQEECKVLARAKDKITITDMSKPHPVYECITPLRNILLKSTRPNEYKAFTNLQDHNEQRRDTDLWRVNQNNVVNFLRNVCGLAGQYTEEEIHSACGVMDTNAFEIRLSNGQRIVGVFPTAAMMAHHCVSNMSHIIDSNNQMMVRAAVPIQRGQPIYMSYALSLEGTRERRALLRYSKFFECDCSRCSDPTECSTYLSALKCQKCSVGNVLPVNPLDEKGTDWRCQLCDYRLTAAVVEKVVNRLKGEFDGIESNDVDKFEEFLRRHSALLHTNHYFFTSARHSLSQLYGRDERYLLNTLSVEQLERKVEICRQLLAVADVVEPGLSRLRGVTLYELHAPLLLLARRHHETGKIGVDQFKEQIESIRSMLTESTKILSLEDRNSREGGMAMAASQALEQIQRWIVTA